MKFIEKLGLEKNDLSLIAEILYENQKELLKHIDKNGIVIEAQTRNKYQFKLKLETGKF